MFEVQGSGRNCLVELRSIDRSWTVKQGGARAPHVVGQFILELCANHLQANLLCGQLNDHALQPLDAVAELRQLVEAARHEVETSRKAAQLCSRPRLGRILE